MPQAWHSQRARAKIWARISRQVSRLAEGRPRANGPPARMRRREAWPTRTREESWPERFIDGRRRFAHVGKIEILTIASPGVALQILPTWAKFRSFLCVDAPEGRSRLELPLGQTLTAPGQEDGNGIGRADDTFPQLEEALHQLHRLDVRHGAQYRPAEALTRWAGFTAARQGVKGFRDPCLEEEEISCAHCSQVRHSPSRSMAGATTVALARPTRASWSA